MKNLAKIKVTKAEQKELLERLKEVLNFNRDDIQKELEKYTKFSYFRLFKHIKFSPQFYEKWKELDPYRLTTKIDFFDDFMISYNDRYFKLTELQKPLGHSQELYLDSNILEPLEFIQNLEI